MRLVDTSAWIEWLLDSPTATMVRPLLPPRAEWLIPTIAQLDLAKWLAHEAGEEKAERVTAFEMRCVVVELDTLLALAAAEASVRYKLPMADAIIYATAQAHDADLVTCDSHFEGLEGVTIVAKHRE